MSPSVHVHRRLVVGIALLFIVALAVARFDTFFRQPQFELGDEAVNALQIDNAKHVDEIYGNYSRFEFHHPGPAFFYVYAASEALLHDLLHVAPTPEDAHLFACVVLQALFFALALAVLQAHVRHRAFLPLALAAAALHFGALGDAFVSTWPPNVLLMPFLCYLAATTSVATGRLNHLLIAAVAGGFLFHGHVAQPLFVGGLGVLALVLGLRNARADSGLAVRALLSRHRRTLWAVGAIIVLFLVPLVIDVVAYGTRSNVATILGRFWYDTDQSNSAFKSFLYFVSFATGTRDQETLFAHVDPALWRFFGAHAWRIAAWAAVFVVPSVVVWLRRRRVPHDAARFLLTAGVFLAATIVLCVLWGKAQAGAMYNFNGYFYYGVYYFALLLALAVVCPLLDRLTPPAVALAIALAAAGYLGWQERMSGSDPEGLQVKNATDAALAADQDHRPKLLMFEHANWPYVAAVALELQRRHVAFYAAPWWTFMFGRGHELTKLGNAPERHASVWWITHRGPGGTPLNDSLSIFTAPAPINPDGGVIDLAGGANAFRYAVEGVSAGNLDCATTELPRVAFRFAAPKTTHDVEVTIEAQPIDLSRPPVLAEVYLNRTPVGRIAFHARSQLSVTIPAAVWNAQPVATLALRIPNAVPQRRIYRPDYTWWAGLQIWRIRFGARAGAATAAGR